MALPEQTSRTLAEETTSGILPLDAFRQQGKSVLRTGVLRPPVGVEVRSLMWDSAPRGRYRLVLDKRRGVAVKRAAQLGG